MYELNPYFPNQTEIQPNPGLIQQSPAKIKQRKSLHFLRRIGPYQGLTLTPRAFFLFAPLSSSKAAAGDRSDAVPDGRKGRLPMTACGEGLNRISHLFFALHRFLRPL
jgi:hypothetical protein